MKTHTKGLLITMIGVLFVVPDALFVRLIDAAPLTIAFWRNMLAGVVIGVVILATTGARSVVRIYARGLLVWLYSAFLGVSGILFVLAVANTSVANVVAIIAALPVFAALLSRVFLGERISARMALTIMCVSAGLGIIAYGSGEGANTSLWGDALALGVAFTFAASLTIARKFSDISMVPAIPLASIGGALTLLPFTDIWAFAPQSWPLIALHGGVFIAVSTIFLSTGPRYLPSAEVALLILLETVLAPLLVWAVLGEALTIWAFIGGGVVVGALVVSNLMLLRR